MQEWKIKQEIYHRLNNEYRDDLNNVDIVISNEYNNIIRHFHEKVDQWIYPAKSYFVAVCYASWIAEDYNEDLIELLRDPMLLAGNDPYFKTYDEDPETYDKILRDIELPLKMNGMVPDVKEYYDEEIAFRI
jgi:hypothetical protein